METIKINTSGQFKFQSYLIENGILHEIWRKNAANYSFLLSKNDIDNFNLHFIAMNCQ